MNPVTEIAEPDPRDPLLDAELIRRRRGRSIALALALGALVVLLFALSIVKGPGAAG